MRKSATGLKIFLAEFCGTTMYVYLGVRVVIWIWGNGSFIANALPSESYRRILTGFLFGAAGCLATTSYVGKFSGSHINPPVSLAFWLRCKMYTRIFIGYVVGQMACSITGDVPLLFWGNQGKCNQYGKTLPGSGGMLHAFLGEVFVTACLITVLYLFKGTKKLRNYTAFAMPF